MYKLLNSPQIIGWKRATFKSISSEYFANNTYNIEKVEWRQVRPRSAVQNAWSVTQHKSSVKTGSS